MFNIVKMEKGLSKFILLAILFLCGCKDKDKPLDEVSPSNFDYSLKNMSEAIGNSPDEDSLYLVRGSFYLKNEKFEEAALDFMQAWKLDSTYPEALHKLSDTYLAYFKSYEALQILTKAAEKFPNSAPTMRHLARLQLILKQYDDGFKSLEKARNIGEGIPETAFLLGIFFKEIGDTARAINSLQEAIEGDADIEDAWIILGQLQEAKGNAIAKKYYETALQRNPSNKQALLAKANFLAKNNELLSALRIFKKMQNLEPENADPFFNAGLIFLDVDSIEQASSQFDQAISLNPLLIEGQFYCGLSAEWLGNNEKAKKHYQLALRLAPDYKEAKDGLARLNK